MTLTGIGPHERSLLLAMLRDVSRGEPGAEGLATLGVGATASDSKRLALPCQLTRTARRSYLVIV